MVWVCTAVSDCQIIRRQCRSEWLEHVEQVYQSIIKHGVLRQAPTIAEAAIQVRIMENDITLTKKRKKQCSLLTRTTLDLGVLWCMLVGLWPL